MNNTKLTILTIVVIIGHFIAYVAVFLYVNTQLTSSTNDVKTTTQQPADATPATTTDPVQLEKEAETLIESDIKKASEKYDEASELYQQAGNEAKAAETAANGESTGIDTAENQITDAPPIESSIRP